MKYTKLQEIQDILQVNLCIDSNKSYYLAWQLFTSGPTGPTSIYNTPRTDNVISLAILLLLVVLISQVQFISWMDS